MPKQSESFLPSKGALTLLPDDVCSDFYPDKCSTLHGQHGQHWVEKESFSHHTSSTICQKSPNFCPSTEFRRGWTKDSDVWS